MADKVVFIVGPTASGKTDLAIAIASAFSGEIVSADSMQIYRGMDIGSAKPTQEERRGIPHHMIDVIGIERSDFSVAAYASLANQCIADILKRGKLPIVVGGTGLYVHALLYPLTFAQTPADLQIRERLNRLDAAQLHDMLKAVDPISAGRLHQNDKKRVVRAIEVFEITGKPFSSHGENFKADYTPSTSYDPIIIGLTMPREQLYERINKRVDAMLEKGLLKEVEAIAKKNYPPDLPALQGLGYKQILSYLQGWYDYETCIALIKQETRRYAKRQITWFKRDPNITWLDAGQYKDSSDLQQAALKLIKTRLNGMEKL